MHIMWQKIADKDRDFCFTFQVTPTPGAKTVAFEKALDVFPFLGKKHTKITILKQYWRHLLPDNSAESIKVPPGTPGR